MLIYRTIGGDTVDKYGYRIIINLCNEIMRKIMHKKAKRISILIAVMLLTVCNISSIAYAYVTISYGYETSNIQIKMRSSYSNVFYQSLLVWNCTSTPIYLKNIFWTELHHLQ